MDVSFQEHIDRLTKQLRSELLRHYEQDVALKERRETAPKELSRQVPAVLPRAYAASDGSDEELVVSPVSPGQRELLTPKKAPPAPRLKDLGAAKSAGKAWNESVSVEK